MYGHRLETEGFTESHAFPLSETTGDCAHKITLKHVVARSLSIDEKFKHPLDQIKQKVDGLFLLQMSLAREWQGQLSLIKVKG